jgi:hypothetical protein
MAAPGQAGTPVALAFRSMKRAMWSVVVSIGGIVAACDKSEHVEPRAVDMTEPAPPGMRPPCPVLTVSGQCRAVAPSDVVTLARGGLVLPAAWFPYGSGGAVAYGVRWGSESLVAVRATTPFAFGEETLSSSATTAATGVVAGDQSVLYFVASGVLQRAAVGPTPAAVDGQPVTVLGDGAGVPLSWAQAAVLDRRRVALALVEPQARIYVGVDEGTGAPLRTWAIPIPEPSGTGLLAHLGTAGDGKWLLSYQVADASWRFHAAVLVSSDEGLTWSPPLELGADSKGPFTISRPDGAADVYYSVSGSPIRRRVVRDGALGVEQDVTAEEVGAVEMPQPRRMTDGRIALMFTIDHGEAEGDLAVTVLDGDAP